MQNQGKKCRYGGSSHHVRLVLLLVVWIFMGLGCASTHKTTKTETVTTYPNEGSVNAGEQSTTTTVTTSGGQQNKGVVGTSETTTTTETKAEHPGIISSTFHAIGYVIVLPFIIIGGLFHIIFGG